MVKSTKTHGHIDQPFKLLLSMKCINPLTPNINKFSYLLPYFSYKATREKLLKYPKIHLG